jgi:hypothetical protein
MKTLSLFAVLTLNLSFCFGQLPKYVNKDSLAGWWPFNGNANDESVNKNHGIVTGASLVNDRFGKIKSAYSFSDYSHIISTNYNSSFYFSGDITMSAWIYSKGYKQFCNWQTIVSKSNIDNFTFTEYNLAINYNYGGPNLDDPTYYKKLFTRRSPSSGFNQEYLFSGDTIIENQWQHVLLTINKDTVRFYLNGKFMGYRSTEKNFTLPNLRLNRGFVFGNSGSINYPYCFNGMIDDIGIWRRALSETEIKHLYRNCILEILAQPISQSSPLNSNVNLFVKTNDPTASYQWQTNLGVGFQNLNNAGQYTGVNNDTLTINGLNSGNNNQLFRCIITTADCIDTSYISTLTIGAKANIYRAEQKNALILSPNPANDMLCVKIEKAATKSSYTIRNCFGSIVKKGILTEKINNIPLENFSNGTYLFQVENSISKKFLIIKK